MEKILGLQFLVPNEIAKIPMNQQSGEWLTWYYFGFSKSFGFILATIQIIGAYLLLQRKTILFAAIILSAFMFNLTLINIFYGLNLGATLQSIIITLGLSYILLLYAKPLIACLFNNKVYINGINQMKNLNFLTVFAILFSVAFVVFLKWYL